MFRRARLSPTFERTSLPRLKQGFFGLMLCGSVALGGLLVGARPAAADPAKPTPQKTVATSNDSHSAAAMYEIEAVQNEKQGRWLGAVAAWRGYARASVEDGAWKKAMDRLHDICGLSWSTSLKAREVLPVLVGKDVVVVPHRVKYSDGLRNVVSGIDPTTGRARWTREDAVAFPYQGDVVVFVQNWEHVARVDLKTGGDAWSHPFPPPGGDHVSGTRNQPGDDLHGEGARSVLGLHDDLVVVQGDRWPEALEIESGKVRWGANPEARPGYRARLTPAGVVTWPGEVRPKGMSDAEWQACPMAMLSYADGKIVWRRKLVPGEPWRVVSGGQRLYVSDPNLQTEIAWTALSLDKGATVWRQPQAEARPSVLVQTDKVLVLQSPDGLENHLTRFLDPSSGKLLWQSEHVVKITPQGLVLVFEPGEPLQAKDIATGKTLWTISQADGIDVDPSGAVVGGSLFFPSHSPGPLSGSDTPGAVSANAASGQLEWSHRAADTPYQQGMRTLALAGDSLLLEQTMQITHPKLAERTPPTQVSSLVALDAGKGDVMWGFYDLAPVSSSPPVRTGDTVYVVGQDRDGFAVYSFDLTRIRTLVKEGRRWWW